MYDAERLYSLLPAIVRLRDAERGSPLRALMDVIATQALSLEENLAQLYDDQFVETAAPWAVPYIGDLIGTRGIYSNVTKALNARAEVANTIAYRRRKGTASMLEQLARDVTGLPARAVEFFQLLATTQYLNHLRLDRQAMVDVRTWEPLERMNTPFTSTARTLEVRRIASGRGKFNIPNVGIFLYRIGAYSLTDSPAAKLNANPADFRYFFDPLGRDTPLFIDPVTEDEITQLAQPINVPGPISRRVLMESIEATKADPALGSPEKNSANEFYTTDKNQSITLVAGQPVKIENLSVCDLSDAGSDWAHAPNSASEVLIDPLLGRIRFGKAPTQPPVVTFHYGFSADMSGGEYPRVSTFDPDLPTQALTAGASIQNALDGLTQSGAIEVPDSGRYDETPAISAAAGQRIELRAADGARPLIMLGGSLTIKGGVDSEVTLNGFLIAGGPIRITGRIKRVNLRHCTLVPGAQPSLFASTGDVTVSIDHCIVGSVRAVKGAAVEVQDSIIDATREDKVAYSASNGSDEGGPLSVVASTIIGKIHCDAMPMVSNAILLARRTVNDSWAFAVHSERTQQGCVRFSFVPNDARVPRRFHCQPAEGVDEAQVRPQFTSARHGDPGYMQLSMRTDPRVRRGADDESEMGAFHGVYLPQRETNLRVRLDEYLRFGLEAGVFYAS